MEITVVGSFDDGLHWQAVVGAGRTLCISHNDRLTCENQLSHTRQPILDTVCTNTHMYVEYLTFNSTG